MQENNEIIPKLEMEKAGNALDEAKILFGLGNIMVPLTVLIMRHFTL